MRENLTDWYTFTKDIIIPAAEVLSTLTIGVVIAVILRRRDEKSNNKQRLIDDYMTFLQLRSNYFEKTALNLELNVLSKLFDDDSDIFHHNANRHIAFGLIKKEIEVVQQKCNSFHKDINWSPYTYRFALLVGLEKYKKHLDSSENMITKSINDDDLEQLSASIIFDITNDQSLLDMLNAASNIRIQQAINKISIVCYNRYSTQHSNVFSPYITDLAELISKA